MTTSAPPDTPIWDDGTWPGLAPLAGTHEVDACVIGLGGSGLACIAALLDRGQSVIGLDAGSVGQGAAGRNGGFLLGGLAQFHHQAIERFGRDRAAALYRMTLGEIERLRAAWPQLVRRTGSLRLAVDPHELADCQHQLDAMRIDDLPAMPYDGPEGGGLLFPADAAFQPLALCRAEAQALRARGAELYEHSVALEITATGVHTPDGVVRCRNVIVCVDGGLDHVLPELRARVRSARLQMLGTAPVPELVLPRPVYARYGYDYWHQLPDRRLAIGGARDLAGEGEWDAPPTASPPVQALLERILHERLRVFPGVTHRWAATVAFTRTGLPILERLASGVIAVGAYNGTGNTVGRLCGRAAADLALGGRPALAALFA
ncbi:MAG TPA: FAD-binding oxidoreductase [Xanthomonadales bacterium]|nr:FAD-binding oxidoreductase [Xanthomonadales bacterium]